MKCPNCHADNPDTSRFCGNCATQLTRSGQPVPELTKTQKSPAQALTKGSLIAGKYRIVEEIGRGGMGVVYDAEDTTLARRVAIKVLPDVFTGDPERMARFEREAKLLASLNHPNIATIHGLEAMDGKRFLVMELVEGETLAELIRRGPLPLKQALEICFQIVEGVAAAHEKGIVHRDLKPSNIKLAPDGTMKVLDFGLAKVFHQGAEATDLSKSPTITEEMTAPGIILGTAAYMSPEQAKGRGADKRADIWAFGCILFECLTGERAFPGDSVTETIAAILKGEPDWSLLPTDTPENVRAVLLQCLRKDLKERLHDIVDAQLEMETPIAALAAQSASRRIAIPWLAGSAVLVLFAGILIGYLLIGRPPALPQVTATIKVVPGHWLDGLRRAQEKQWPSRKAMAISADGQFTVYSAVPENPDSRAKPRLYLRRMDLGEAKPIAGTEGGINPFLSPDNRWVGFWADGKLKKVPVEGGVPADLCNVVEIFGASWGPGNIIVFTDNTDGGLSGISAEGGTVESLTSPDPKREASSHRLPSWLPNGKGVLFTVVKDMVDPRPRLALLDFGTRQWIELLPDAADARFVSTGHLVFLRQGTLMAARFDPAKMKVIGQPVPVMGKVMQAFAPWGDYNTAAGQFDVSDTGSLVYAAGGVLPDMRNSLVWVDQKGLEQEVTPLRLPFQAPRVSPDGHRIAYVTAGREWQVYFYDLDTDTNSQLTHEGMSARAIWTPKGDRILFDGHGPSGFYLSWQPYDGRSPMESLLTSGASLWPGSWSADGRTLAIVEGLSKTGTGYDISLLDTSSGRVRPFLNSQFDESYPEFSPDGRWIAYASNESGRNEVYIRPFPGPGIKRLVSTDGGIQPLWAKDVTRLFFRRQDQILVADVRTGGGLSTGKPRLLFEQTGYSPGSPIRSYDLSLDGQRFLMVKLEQRTADPVTEMIFVQNWFEELKRLVPAGKK